MLDRAGVSEFKCRAQQLNYAFERSTDLHPSRSAERNTYLDAVNGVPAYGTYLEVVYSAEHAQLDRDIRGRTFSRVFGARASPVENLLLRQRIQGPQWIALQNCKPNPNPVSWCRFGALHLFGGCCFLILHSLQIFMSQVPIAFTLRSATVSSRHQLSQLCQYH